MGDYYDRDGAPMTMEQWAGVWGPSADGDDPRRVALTNIGDDITVSTVWLGLDHQFGGGPPLIFETMIFGGEFDEDQERYATEGDAIVGHAYIVDLLKADV